MYNNFETTTVKKLHSSVSACHYDVKLAAFEIKYLYTNNDLIKTLFIQYF